jgi:hypothetical protein
MFDAEVILKRRLDESRRITFLGIGDTMLELMEMGPASEPAEPMKHYGVHHIGIKTDDFESARANSWDSPCFPEGTERCSYRVGPERPRGLSRRFG